MEIVPSLTWRAIKGVASFTCGLMTFLVMTYGYLWLMSVAFAGMAWVYFAVWSKL